MATDPQPTTLWITSWVLANVPFLCAGVISAIVRFVILCGTGAPPIRDRFREAFLCLVIVAVSKPISDGFRLSDSWAMAIAVGVALGGPENVANIALNKIKSIFGGGSK